MATLNLNTLLVSTKSVETEFPGYPGFKLNLCFLSREEILKIRKKATKVVFKNRQPTDEFNDELFIQLYTQAVVKGWSGFKLSYLEKLAPVDLSAQKDLDAELDYTEENALLIMKSSADFDSFVTETVSDLANFQKSSGK